MTVVTLALMGRNVSAAGFGEINLISRLGEPLQAEVAIIASGSEPISYACFSLAPVRDADMPVIASAQIQLVRRNGLFVLAISDKNPVVDPVFMLVLRAHCGIEVERTFVLLPQPPVGLIDRPAPPAIARPDEEDTQKSLRVGGGDSLYGSNAASPVATDVAKQRPLPSAMRRDVSSRPPTPHKPAAAAPSDSMAQPQQASAPRPAKPTASAAGKDRLVLGAPPVDAIPKEKASTAAENPANVNERLQKLEQVVGLLHQELGKLDEAIVLATEAVAARQKLQEAKAVISALPAPVVAASSSPQLPAPAQDSGLWWQFLLSALTGGTISAAALTLANRRRSDSPRRPESHPGPLTHANAPDPVFERVAQPVSSSESAPLVITLPTSEQASAVESRQLLVEDGQIDVSEISTTASLLRLAEILLSFGHAKDAAEALAEYIEQTPPKNIQPWMLLLDLYKRQDMRREFDDLARRMCRHFNVLIPTWDGMKSDSRKHLSLEDFPHIMRALVENWGRQNAMELLDGLIQDTRSGQRHGFPLEVMEQIVLLVRVLEDGYGLCLPERKPSLLDVPLAA